MMRRFSNELSRAHLSGWVVVIAIAGCGSAASKPEISYSATQGPMAAEFDRAADRPPNAKTLYAMARILAAQGAEARSADVLGNTIRQYPNFLPAYFDLSDLQLRQNKIDLAARTLAAGLSISPRESFFINNLGMCWMWIGSYDRALEMFTQAAGIQPLNPRYRANMAVCLGMLGREEESLAVYEQILSPPDAQHNLDVLRQARVRLALTDDGSGLNRQGDAGSNSDPLPRTRANTPASLAVAVPAKGV